MRIIEWFDMVASFADQASSANTCVSCDGSYGGWGWMKYSEAGGALECGMWEGFEDAVRQNKAGAGSLDQ